MTRARDDGSGLIRRGFDAVSALVCDMPARERDGRRVSVQTLLERATGWSRCGDGVLLEFPGGEEIARELLDFVLVERQCCSHFTYDLEFAPKLGGVSLRIRASGLYRVALKMMYGELARQAGMEHDA